jgi:acetylglutamate kinase
MNMKTIVVKMGGVASDNLNDAFFQKISSWQNQGYRVIIVHGGGHYISKMMDILGIKVEVKQGLRVTSEKTLEFIRSSTADDYHSFSTSRFSYTRYECRL